MTILDRDKFIALCRAIKNGNVALLDYRNVETGERMSVICTTKAISKEQIECLPLAQLLELSLSPVVVPVGPMDDYRNPELN